MPRTKKTEEKEEKIKDKEKAVAKVKKDKEKEKKIVEETAEEFPDMELGFDVFSEAGSKERKAELKGDKKKLEELKKKVFEKAKELAEGVKDVSSEELKEEVKDSQRGMVVPLEEYVKSGIHLGTRVITPRMRQYVYRRRADGLAVLNTNLINEKMKEAIEFFNKFKPEDVIIVCKRESGWQAVKMFSELTGVRVFTKKYPAGIITNTQLPDFFEPELIMVCDPWIDKNALTDANHTKRKVLALCDTNNYVKGMDQIIPCNNKSGKSLGLIFWILATEYCKKHGIKTKIPPVEKFIGEEGE